MTHQARKAQHGKLWNVLWILAAVVLGLILSARPWRVFLEQRDQVNQYERQMRTEEQKRVELTRRQAELTGPLGREQAAREAGLLKKGEVPATGP